MSSQDAHELIDSAGRTHRGLERSSNEDQFLISDLSKSLLVHQTSLSVEDRSRITGRSQGLLMAVADGMGGHAGGERASALALRAITQFTVNAMPWFLGLRHDSDDDLRDVLASALQPCQMALQADAEQHPVRASMGTTLTMLYLLWPRAFLVHAGDSRGYLLRGGELRQMTRDHSVGQKLVDQGTWTEEQAKDSPLWETLWNAITADGDDPPQAEVKRLTLQPKDTLLVCTDGLTKHLSDERIAEILANTASAADAVDTLISAALDDGGSDNVTVVVARC